METQWEKDYWVLLFAAQPEGRSLKKKTRETGVELRQIGIGFERAKEKAYPLFDSLVSLPHGVIHFGFSGGLSEKIFTGTVVIPHKIIGPTGAALSPSWELRNKAKKICETRALPFIEGSLFTSDKILKTPQEKKEAGEKWGAVAVDTETYPYAKVCLEKKIPFLSLRAVWDPLEWDITLLESCQPLEPEGDINIKGLVVGVLKHPKLLMQLPKYRSAAAKASQILALLITKLLE